VGPRWKSEAGRERASLLQVLLKLMLIYGKGGTIQYSRNGAGHGCFPSQARARMTLEPGGGTGQTTL
jgi:hypothetical protein